MAAPVLSEARPFSQPGGPAGALVLHGFTGNPQSMRPLAEALAGAGFSVDLPLLPGHGTAVEDMVPTRWEDWAAAAEDSFGRLASACASVVVAGLSMGGTLACLLAERHPEIAGLAVVNPLVEPPAEAFRDILRGLQAQGVELAPKVGSDIAMKGSVELSYDATPVAAALSLFAGVDEVAATLDSIVCPVLICNSPHDHVVPPSSSDLLAASVAGPVTRVPLERSYHVATLDHDAALVEERVVEFALAVTSAARVTP